MNMLTRYNVTENRDGMGFSNGLSLDDGGDYVSYSDYEKLKRAYDALAEDMTAAQGQIADAQIAQEKVVELLSSICVAQTALVLWDMAYRTSQDGPLAYAFESGVGALSLLKDKNT